MPEYSIPIMFDVTAPDRETAGRAVVEILARHWRGAERYGGGPRWALDHTQQVQVESWWTIEAQDKRHDRNDNDPGEVVFYGRCPHLGHPCGQCGTLPFRPAINPHDPAHPFTHMARPDDEYDHRCKDCGRIIVWLGPNQSDWEHADV